MSRKGAVHNLKTWTQFFDQIVVGYKRFEVRKNDRDFQVGDYLMLQDWDPVKFNYTGRVLLVQVTYKMDGGSFGLEPGYCIMSISTPAEFVEALGWATTAGGEG